MAKVKLRCIMKRPELRSSYRDDPRTNDPETIAVWWDLVSNFKKESEYVVRRTSTLFATLYTMIFEKQKVTYALQVFKEKIIVTLNIQGSIKTAKFVKLVLQMWKCLNIKSSKTYYMLFDDDMKCFANAIDERLEYLASLMTMFKSIDTYSGLNETKILGLTTDTSTELHFTLNGIVKIIKLLSKNIKYALTVEFQSDRTEGKFGIYRQYSKGNYSKLIWQVINSLNFPRLKLFNILSREQSFSHHHNSSCTKSWGEHEVDGLDTCHELFAVPLCLTK